jgi:uncharacterized protein YgiM (DUF1202 family)
MKKMIVLLTMLLCIASSCFAAEERSTKDIFADTTIANVVITGDQLRVRTHPDLDGYIIKKLDKGTVCKFMNKVDDKNGTDSWIYIIMEDGTVGCVFGAYARIEGNVDVQ